MIEIKSGSWMNFTELLDQSGGLDLRVVQANRKKLGPIRYRAKKFY
jgi:hypothetical protein